MARSGDSCFSQARVCEYQSLTLSTLKATALNGCMPETGLFGWGFGASNQGRTSKPLIAITTAEVVNAITLPTRQCFGLGIRLEAIRHTTPQASTNGR